MKKGTAKKSLSKGKKAASARSKKAASTRSGKSASASAKSAAAKPKKSAAAGKTKTAATKPGNTSAGKPLVAKNPQSKQQAALQHGMFLHTDDAWSLAYYNNNDLHNIERQLFG